MALGKSVGEKERGGDEGLGGIGEINDNVRHWDEATSKRGVMNQEGKGEVGGEQPHATTMPNASGLGWREGGVRYPSSLHQFGWEGGIDR